MKKETWKLKQDNELSNTDAEILAQAVAISLQKAGFEISHQIYLQLPEKYKKYFE